MHRWSEGIVFPIQNNHSQNQKVFFVKACSGDLRIGCREEFFFFILLCFVLMSGSEIIQVLLGLILELFAYILTIFRFRVIEDIEMNMGSETGNERD